MGGGRFVGLASSFHLVGHLPAGCFARSHVLLHLCAEHGVVRVQRARLPLRLSYHVCCEGSTCVPRDLPVQGERTCALVGCRVVLPVTTIWEYGGVLVGLQSSHTRRFL